MEEQNAVPVSFSERHSPLPITAFALTNCLGASTQEVLDNLFAGNCGLSPCKWPLPFTTWAGEAKGELAALPESEKAYDSRAARLLARPLSEMTGAIAHALKTWGSHRVGIVLGTSTGGIAETEAAAEAFRETGAVPSSFDFDRQHAFGGLVEFARTRTGIQGPAYAVSTACSSSGKVLACAQRLIMSGICDAVLVGGSDSLCQTTLRGFGSLEVVSSQPCRPFCAERNGLNIGEGAALLLVEREATDGAKAQAKLLGVGESSDAWHMSHPHPEGVGAIAAMRQALDQAGLTPSDVDHVNAHGTGTNANDEVEGKAIQSLLGSGVPVVSTKAYTGHMLGAGGASEAIFAIAAIQRGVVPMALRAHPLDSAFSIFVPEAPVARDLNVVLSNSFAFGGSNVCVAIGKA